MFKMYRDVHKKFLDTFLYNYYRYYPKTLELT